jgi:hypothetical protein
MPPVPILQLPEIGADGKVGTKTGEVKGGVVANATLSPKARRAALCSRIEDALQRAAKGALDDASPDGKSDSELLAEAYEQLQTNRLIHGRSDVMQELQAREAAARDLLSTMEKVMGMATTDDSSNGWDSSSSSDPVGEGGTSSTSAHDTVPNELFQCSVHELNQLLVPLRDAYDGASKLIQENYSADSDSLMNGSYLKTIFVEAVRATSDSDSANEGEGREEIGGGGESGEVRWGEGKDSDLGLTLPRLVETLSATLGLRTIVLPTGTAVPLTSESLQKMLAGYDGHRFTALSSAGRGSADSAVASLNLQEFEALVWTILHESFTSPILLWCTTTHLGDSSTNGSSSKLYSLAEALKAILVSTRSELESQHSEFLSKIRDKQDEQHHMGKANVELTKALRRTSLSHAQKRKQEGILRQLEAERHQEEVRRQGELIQDKDVELQRKNRELIDEQEKVLQLTRDKNDAILNHEQLEQQHVQLSQQLAQQLAQHESHSLQLQRQLEQQHESRTEASIQEKSLVMREKTKMGEVETHWRRHCLAMRLYAMRSDKYRQVWLRWRIVVLYRSSVNRVLRRLDRRMTERLISQSLRHWAQVMRAQAIAGRCLQRWMDTTVDMLTRAGWRKWCEVQRCEEKQNLENQLQKHGSDVLQQNKQLIEKQQAVLQLTREKTEIVLQKTELEVRLEQYGQVEAVGKAVDQVWKEGVEEARKRAEERAKKDVEQEAMQLQRFEKQHSELLKLKQELAEQRRLLEEMAREKAAMSKHQQELGQQLLEQAMETHQLEQQLEKQQAEMQAKEEEAAMLAAAPPEAPVPPFSPIALGFAVGLKTRFVALREYKYRQAWFRWRMRVQRRVDANRVLRRLNGRLSKHLISQSLRHWAQVMRAQAIAGRCLQRWMDTTVDMLTRAGWRKWCEVISHAWHEQLQQDLELLHTQHSDLRTEQDLAQQQLVEHVEVAQQLFEAQQLGVDTRHQILGSWLKSWRRWANQRMLKYFRRWVHVLNSQIVATRVMQRWMNELADRSMRSCWHQWHAASRAQHIACRVMRWWLNATVTKMQQKGWRRWREALLVHAAAQSTSANATQQTTQAALGAQIYELKQLLLTTKPNASSTST